MFKMKKTIAKNVLIGIVALASAGLASQPSAEGNWYLGGALSQAFVDQQGINDDDTGGKVFGGYKYNEYVAVEAAYYNFGDIDTGTSQLEVDGLSLAVVGSISVSDSISVFGKVGAHEWDVKDNGTIASQMNSNGDTDAFYGLGVDYVIDESWSVRGELERYEVQNLDYDVASAAVSYNF
ncbi:MAG: OOP family OmpA-OmpF porin [Urechidicola sp.]|jgi:OOP family OmpA-OmpF porin